MVAAIVEPPAYVDANSLVHGSRALSFVGGQSLGGILVQVATAPGAILTATVPDVLRARVSGACSTINYGLRPAGAIAGGTLGATLGLRSTQEMVAATLPAGAVPGGAQPETSGTKSVPTIS